MYVIQDYFLKFPVYRFFSRNTTYIRILDIYVELQPCLAQQMHRSFRVQSGYWKGRERNSNTGPRFLSTHTIPQVSSATLSPHRARHAKEGPVSFLLLLLRGEGGGIRKKRRKKRKKRRKKRKNMRKTHYYHQSK